MAGLLDLLRETFWQKPSGPTGVPTGMDEGVSVPREFLRASSAPFLTGGGALLGIAQGLKESADWLQEATHGGARRAAVLGEEGDPSFLGRGLFATADVLVGSAPGGGTGVANMFRKSSPKAIAAAEALLAKGMSVEDAAKATAAWRTKAGWVSEMPDEGAMLKRGLEHYEGMTLPLEDVIKHPTLLAEFPELGRESVVRITEPGWDPGFTPYGKGQTGGMITLPSNASLEDAIHEGQHLVAHHEGLASGTSGVRELARIGGKRYLDLQERLKAISEKWGPESGKWPLSAAREFSENMAEVMKLNKEADRAYWRDPGEMLAREAESRLPMSSAERAQWPLTDELLLRAGSKQTSLLAKIMWNWDKLAERGKGRYIPRPWSEAGPEVRESLTEVIRREIADRGPAPSPEEAHRMLEIGQGPTRAVVEPQPMELRAAEAQSKLLRSVWYHGDQYDYPFKGRRQRQVEGLKKGYWGGSFQGKQFGTGNLGEPREMSLSADPSVSSRFGHGFKGQEPQAIRDYRSTILRYSEERLNEILEYKRTAPPEQQDVLYQQARKIERQTDSIIQELDYRKIARVFPIYGGPPEKKVLDATRGVGREALNEAYVKAEEEFLRNTSRGTRKQLNEVFAAMENAGVDPATKVKQYLEFSISPKEKLHFNETLTADLAGKGYMGVLHNPTRYDEAELRLFDSGNALYLDLARPHFPTGTRKKYLENWAEYGMSRPGAPLGNYYKLTNKDFPEMLRRLIKELD